MNRPKIVKGDIVKLSKKGLAYPREFCCSSSLIVTGVMGDGIDKNSVIECVVKIEGKQKRFKFFRSELWATKQNVIKGVI